VARRPRENIEGGIYHVYARGNAGDLVFRDDADNRRYLRRLSDVVVHRQWRCLAYCLMKNHLHLLIETKTANLSSGMQRLQGGYAQSFNTRYERTGHVFQGRYGAVRMQSDGQVCTAAAYIARNPVAAGLCDRPDEWSWSSYRSVAAGRPAEWLDANRLLQFFSENPGPALSAYAAMSGMPFDSRLGGLTRLRAA
jgi:putative transposase